jgi:uncharacterized protein (DUF302 family)
MPDSPIGSVENGVISKTAMGSVGDTVSRLTQLIEERGMLVFTIIDHSGEAEKIGLELRDTKVVVFGSPAAGTPIMQASPLAALDLPLRVLVWDNGGQSTLSYIDPDVLAERHNLSPELAGRLAGIGPLTDALSLSQRS